MSICVYEMNNHFVELVSGKTKGLQLTDWVANNTTITSLHVDNIVSYKDVRQELFEGLQRNTTLVKLSIGCLVDDIQELPNNGIKTLHIRDAGDGQVFRMIKNNTTLETLHVDLCIIDKFFNGKLLKYLETNKNILELKLYVSDGAFGIDTSCFENYLNCLCKNDTLTSIYCYSTSNFNKTYIHALLTKPHLKSLFISKTLFIEGLFSKFLATNTTLETLHIDWCPGEYTHLSYHLRDNTSIVNYKQTINMEMSFETDILDSVYAKRNRELRWKFRQPIFLDLIIALYPLKVWSDSLPPYILLWIFDWLYSDNIYCKHFQKITYITGVINSIRRIKKDQVESLET